MSEELEALWEIMEITNDLSTSNAGKILQIGNIARAILSLPSSAGDQVVDLNKVIARYRYVVGWMAADSWDMNDEGRQMLQWAKAMDPGSSGDFTAIASEYHAYEESRGPRQVSSAREKPGTEDIVGRLFELEIWLRSHSPGEFHRHHKAADDVRKAAARIQAYRARIEELEGALEPFCKAADALSDNLDQDCIWLARIDDKKVRLTVGDLRRARALKSP